MARRSVSRFYSQVSPLTRRNVDLVILDGSGTIFDPFAKSVIESMKSSFRKYGIMLSEAAIAEGMGLKKIDHIKQLISKHTKYDKEDKLVNDIYFSFMGHQKYFLGDSQFTRPLIGMRELFRYCQREHIPIAATTGFNLEMINIIKRTLPKEVTPVPFVSTDLIRRGRPFSDEIEYVLQYYKKASANSTLKAGDTLFDIKEGVNSKCKYVVGLSKHSSMLKEKRYVMSDGKSDEELVKFDMMESGANYVVADGLQLIKLIGSLNT